jgi:phage major head subunit gpT-like protein
VEFLTTAELAALADIAESNARKAIRTCLAGKKWRGAELVVSKPDGKAHAVFAPSLPQVLYEKWLEAQPKPPVPVQEARQLPTLPETPGIRLPEPEWVEEAKWKRALIEPALAHPHGSRARGGEVEAIARREGIKKRTLSDWIKRFEDDGFEGLVRQRRHDAPRVFITRKWDAACQLPDETKAAIAEKITTHVKSLWRTANSGCNNTARLATTELQRLCHEAGWDGATLEHCRITRAAVEKYRHYSLVHTFGKDAKAFFDHDRPRIQRDYSGLQPMELVVGDVHPLDVVVRRDDGSIATPRFIAWIDAATRRLRGTIVLLDKATGVTQADVWASIVNDDFEVTVRVKRNDIEDDQLGIYSSHAQMAGFSARQLPDEIVAELKNDSFTNKCYDGQPFYDTDHPVTSSDNVTTSVSNKLTVALSAATPAAAAASFGAARLAILTFKDDEGRPLSLMPDVLEVPPALETTANMLMLSDKLVDNSPNPYKGMARVLVNPRLTSDTAWFLHVTNMPVKPFIYQERKAPVFVSQTDMQADDVFNNAIYAFGAEARAAGGYGFWQMSVGSTGA